MDEPYLLKTLTYVELNPVKVNIVKSLYGYRWSSAKAHKKGQDSKGHNKTESATSNMW
jgi:putative transposase